MSTAMATSIQLATLAIAPHFKTVRPGPYAFIFTFLVQYYSKLFLALNEYVICKVVTKNANVNEPPVHTPRIYPRMFYFYVTHGSDKLVYYFLGLLVCVLNHPWCLDHIL